MLASARMALAKSEGTVVGGVSPVREAPAEAVGHCWHCAGCLDEITSDTNLDNRYRGCSVCGWVMHHDCWSEGFALGTLPCPMVEGQYPNDHVDIIGMRGEWEGL